MADDRLSLLFNVERWALLFFCKFELKNRKRNQVLWRQPFYFFYNFRNQILTLFDIVWRSENGSQPFPFQSVHSHRHERIPLRLRHGHRFGLHDFHQGRDEFGHRLDWVDCQQYDRVSGSRLNPGKWLYSIRKLAYLKSICSRTFRRTLICRRVLMQCSTGTASFWFWLANALSSPQNIQPTSEFPKNGLQRPAMRTCCIRHQWIQT